MAAPIGIPIMWTGENYPVPDFSRYDANAEARLARIRERQDRQAQIEAAQDRKMADMFFKQTGAIERAQLNERGLREAQGKLINGYVEHMTNVYAKRKGKPTYEDLMQARALEQEIETKINRLSAWEQNHKEDLKMIAKDPKKWDADTALSATTWSGTTPYDSSRLKVRTPSGAEVAQQAFENYLSEDKVDEFSNVVEQDGIKIDSKVELIKRFFHTDEEGTLMFSPNHKEQMRFEEKTVFSDGYNTQSIMREFDKLSPKQKAFYINAAENGHKGAGILSDKDFTVKGTGVKKDAYKFYFHDKYSDMMFKMNKEFDRGVSDSDEKKSEIKYKNGAAYINGKPYLNTTQNVVVGGVNKPNYFPITKGIKNLPGKINQPYTDPINGEMDGDAILPSDFDFLGVWSDDNGKEWLHLKVNEKGEQAQRDGKPLFDFGQNRKMTMEEVDSRIRSLTPNPDEMVAVPEGMRENFAGKQRVEKWRVSKQQYLSMGNIKPSYTGTQQREIWAPADSNPDLRNAVKIKKSAIKQVRPTPSGNDKPQKKGNKMKELLEKARRKAGGQ